MTRWIVVAALVAGCGEKADSPAPPPQGSAAPGSGSAAADACAHAEVRGDIAWIEDDYPAALACARAKKVPLVLDLWAPWCHTCLSMQTTVFLDPALTPSAQKFVFAAIDTDRENNAAAVAKYPLAAWPTFYVVGDDESVLARFSGAASVTQFSAFLAAGEAARAAVDGSAKHLLAAERALAQKNFAVADSELGAAVDAAPDGWARLPDALVSWVHTKFKRDDAAGCLDVAEKYIDKTGNAASATDFIAIASGCAKDVEDKSDDAAKARIKKLRETAVTRLTTLLADASAPLSTDDRSDAMANARELYLSLGNKTEATKIAQAQKALLVDAIAKAPSPTAASTFNYQLADVGVFLGTPLDVVPQLEASAKALPNEYDPAARLGWVYLEAGKLDEATLWIDKALALVYGPRKARVLELRAQIANKWGDAAGEKQYRAQIVELWKSLPPGQQNPGALKKAEAALAKLDASVSSGSAAR